VARRRLLRQSVPLPTSVSLLRRPELVVLSDAQTRDPVPMLAWVVRKFGFGQCHDLATPTRADLVLWPGRPDGQTGCVGGPPSVRPSCCHGSPCHAAGCSMSDSAERRCGKGAAASPTGVSWGTAHFGPPTLLGWPAPGELGPPRAGSVTRRGGRPKGLAAAGVFAGSE